MGRVDATFVVLALFGIVIGVGCAAILGYFVVRGAVTDGMKRYWQWRVEEDAKQRAASRG